MRAGAVMAGLGLAGAACFVLAVALRLPAGWWVWWGG